MFRKRTNCCLLTLLVFISLLCCFTTGQAETRIEAHEVPDFVNSLIAVAKGEIGYIEGPNNYSKYGEWAGDPNAQWCAEFVCWCINQCDELYQTDLLNHIYPFWTGQNTGRNWFIERGRFVYRVGNCPKWGYQWEKGADHYLKKNEYIPGPGDLVYFSYSSSGDTMHVALIEYVTRNENNAIQLHVIEGNNPDRVQQNVYPLNNSQVLGFGICSDQIDTAMRVGCSGDKVLELQKVLHAMGYLESEYVTGTYLSSTKSAIAAFQRENMNERHYYGVADRETVQLLQILYEQDNRYNPENWLVEEE